MTTEERKPDLRVIESDPASIFDDLAALRKATKLTVQRKAVLVNVQAGNPPQDTYFRTNPDPNMTLEARIVRDRDKQLYFVTPSMYTYPKLARRLRKVTLVLVCLWPGGEPQIWPVPAPVEDQGRDFPAWRSAREAHKLSLEFWTQITWDKEKNDFVVEPAEKLDADIKPTWPDKPFSELLKLAFDGKIIDNEDHPYVRLLRGIID